MKKGLLLGAGFSYDFGMPLTSELTEVFLGLFNQKNLKKLAIILSNNEPYTKDRPINKKAILEGLNLLLSYKIKKEQNYEKFLIDLNNPNKKTKLNQSDKDSYHYLSSIFYEIIHKILSIYQIVSYETLYKKNFKWFSNFEILLSEKETWVFTLNHDLYYECLVTDLNLPITYGDDEKITFPLNNLKLNENIELSCIERSRINIENNKYFKNEKGNNLVKLHGGINEFDYKDKSIICNIILDKQSSIEIIDFFKKIDTMGYYYNNQLIPSGKDRVITNSKGELDIVRKSMLTGGNKYCILFKNNKKFQEKIILFKNVLSQLDQLTVIGYGFGDRHINLKISNAMVLNENLKIEIIDPLPRNIPDFLEQFDYESRIKIAQCTIAEWIEFCKNNKWNLNYKNALKENEELRLDIKKKVIELLEVYNHNLF